MLRIRVVVVTYNTKWFDSDTIKSLLSIEWSDLDVELVIWDNSPLSQFDQQIVDRLEQIYSSVSTVHCEKNEGLAKVYNTVSDSQQFDLFVIFDQDTIFDRGYFIKLVEAAEAKVSQVFLPIVFSGELIVSPGAYRLVKGKHWSSRRTGLLPSAGVVAISSGLAVTREYIERWCPAFDERMNLYGIDTAFMLSYARREGYVFVLDYDLKHHTVLWSNPPKSVMLFRFRNLRRARLIIHRNDPLLYPLALAYAVHSSLKMALRYRDLAFLRA